MINEDLFCWLNMIHENLYSFSFFKVGLFLEDRDFQIRTYKEIICVFKDLYFRLKVCRLYFIIFKKYSHLNLYILYIIKFSSKTSLSVSRIVHIKIP